VVTEKQKMKKDDVKNNTALAFAGSNDISSSSAVMITKYYTKFHHIARNAPPLDALLVSEELIPEAHRTGQL